MGIHRIFIIGGLVASLLSFRAANGAADICYDYLSSGAARQAAQPREKAIRRDSLDSLMTERGLVLAAATSTSSKEIQYFLNKERTRNRIDVSKATGIDADLKSIKDSYDKAYGEFVVVKNATGEIVATAGLLRVGADEGEIRKVFVSEAVSRMGLEKILVQHLLKKAEEIGYSSLSLETYAHLKDAINLYQTVGFEKTSVRIESAPDILIFRKKINRPSAAEGLRSESEKRAYFQALHQRFTANRGKLKEILSTIETQLGVEYELRQVEDTILNAASLELSNLQRTKPLKNVAVYGSTNIPLYTLIMHSFIPLTVADAVWFRTPKATRETYRALYETIAMDAPPGTYAGLHLLTDARDVQYDNFRRLHVMGSNLKGTQSLRPPSEVVVFTGGPETGREILRENIKKLEHQTDFEKQIFLMFGAGMNPLVISKDAVQDLPSAVRSTMDSVLINSGQDCIAPNFLLVDEAVAPKFLEQLKTSLSHVRVAANGPPETTIKPLTFAETLDGLVDFRNQYADHLANRDQATINVETRSVAPHLFVFKGDELPSVPLREHFAPFLVVFTYKDHAQFQKLIQDPRVQQKVMYASVFGAPHATAEVSTLVQMLQENRHAVSVNRSIYADESGNMAFGGIGPDSSTVTTIQNKNGALSVSTSQRPLLFSEEAAREFSESVVVTPSADVRKTARQVLKQVIAQIDQDPRSVQPVLYGWETLVNPQGTNRPTGLKALRSEIQRNGLTRVVNTKTPSDPEAKAKLERFYGTKLAFSADPSTPPIVKGVAIHITSVDEGPSLLNRVRGDINPHLGRGNLVGLVDGNKRLEYFLAEAVQPGVMPATETIRSLKKENVLGARFTTEQKALEYTVDQYLAKGKPLTNIQMADLQAHVAQFVQIIFEAVRVRFPQGAYLKNFDDFATADLGTQITSFSTNPSHVAQQFVMRLNEILVNKRTDVELFTAFEENPYEMGSKFVLHALKKADPMIVQVREEIAKTAQGQNLEFRVDFLDGETLHSKPRFSREYYPQEAADAARFLNEFFAKAPAELRHLSGGADVARTKDGRWIIIEFNFGSSSGTWVPKLFILDSHETISSLQGFDTPLLSQLKATMERGPDSVVALFRSLKLHNEPWNKKSLDDLSAVELGRWIRDYYLQRWSKTGATEATAKQVLDDIHHVLTSRGEIGEELQKIINGADEYVARELRRQARH
jgi:aldehyde dehydrogenase (NAD+)